jgi:hypothetical protein
MGLLLLGHGALGQSAPVDSASLVASNGLWQQYANTVGYESGLYSGPEYVRYTRVGARGFVFFSSEEEQPATVEYGGQTYTNVPLRYDIVRGQLLVEAPLANHDLSLVNERVTRFTLPGHSFVRLVAEPGSNSPIKTGFYEVLVEGPVRVLAAYRKTVEELTTSGGIVSTISDARSEYFAWQNGRYYRVAKASELLNLFPQHKAALRKYMQDKNLDFGEDTRGYAIAELVRYQATLAPAAN